MTAEAMSQSQSEHRGINLLPDYPPCAGHPGSSKYNWVPVDYVGYLLSKALHVTDEDYKKKGQQK